MITKVTITGADDSISPAALIPLNDKYPFVEWGILVSQRNYGNNRFPTSNWLKQLSKLFNHEIKLSCHLCGKYVRELTHGNNLAMRELGFVWNIFQRIQLNFHAIPHIATESLNGILQDWSDKEFIFQYDNVNNEIAHLAIKRGIDCSILFDTSGGAGILPNSWPEPIEEIKCGYAGGISPENIEEQMKLINNIVGEKQTWIDMETHVRSNNDYQFDLEKVEKCLEIASKFITISNGPGSKS